MQELRMLARDGRLRWGLTLTLLLFLLSLALGLGYQRQQVEIIARAQVNERERWVEQGIKNPHSAAHWGVLAFRPRLRLSALDPGLEPYLGSTIYVEAHKQNAATYRPVDEASSLARFGRLTAAFVLQSLVPLLIVILTFASVAGERENGLLRLALSLGIGWPQYLLGKIAGAFLVLGPLALMVTLACTLADPGRGAAMALLYLYVYALWTAGGVLVSALAPTSRQALLTLLALWFVNAFVAERLAFQGVAALDPVPSGTVFTTQLEDRLEHGWSGGSSTQKRRLALRRRLFELFGVKTQNDLPIAFEGVVLQSEEQHGYATFDQMYGELFATYERQDQSLEWAGLLAPHIAVAVLSRALAGTDLEHHRHFADAAETYRRQEIALVNADITRNGAHKSVYEADASLWVQIPAFRYDNPALDWVLTQRARAVSVLATWAIGLLVAFGLVCRSARVDP